ncbi:2-methylaconitate cis-trans isomerase PrpF family protein [Ammoniphilus sp. CFH 90114]|uniref:2-methylaconitate cis-trans isomerase PrpF family protein n=1 Tax=Ammoniphilus sp. CFH 90114 TaxID=2493665 RepID=UPI00100FDE0B|nr:PrpF domain-containing protein [Ammoniphilus sp. CFH 90114]RXT00682.1 PrpF protein [Ammoniphilus sp. CFH 90114]
MFAYGQLNRIPSTLMRGGTSKGLILRSVDLPKSPILRDQIILKIFGNGNSQIDGIGGGTSLTSKLALVGPPAHPDAHINYTFGQVSLEKMVIDYKVTCGNMASAVGLYAAEEGYVNLEEPLTSVRIFNTNTDRMIEVQIPVKDGQIQYDGDFYIAGVSGTASRIMVNFLDAGGTFTGKTLPTGNTIDTIQLEDGREFSVSIIDTANIVVFIGAEALGLTGTELSSDINGNPTLMATLEEIRVKAGIKIGVIDRADHVTPTTHALPKIAMVSPVRIYDTENGTKVTEQEIDIVARYISMGSLHRAFAVSGAIALGSAVKIPGTIPNQMVLSNEGGVRIGHPTGTIYVEVQAEKAGEEWNVIRGGIGRTARRLMDGYAYVPTSVLSGEIS